MSDQQKPNPYQQDQQRPQTPTQPLTPQSSVAPGYVPQSHMPFGQYPQGSYPQTQYPPGSYSPTNYPQGPYNPMQYHPGAYMPSNCPPGSYQPAQQNAGPFIPSQFPPGSYSPIPSPPSQYHPGSYSPGLYPSPQQHPGSFVPSQHPTGAYVSGSSSPSQYPTGPYQPAQSHPSQYPPGSYQPSQYPSGQNQPVNPQAGINLSSGSSYHQQYGQPQGFIPQNYQNSPAQSYQQSSIGQTAQQPCEQKPNDNKPCSQTDSASCQQMSQGHRQKFILIGFCVGSLKISSDFDATNDAKALERAFKGFGCDTKTVVKILTHRSSIQREQIKTEYKKLFGKCLIERTKKELLDPLEHVMVTLLYAGAEQDTYLLRKAMKGLGTFDDILIQIFCTRSSEQIIAIKNSYERMYGRRLVESIKGDTSGNFRKLLLHLIEKPRQQSGIDQQAALNIATSIYEKSTVKTAAPESLIEKLCSCSYEQFILINNLFSSQCSKHLHKYFKSYMVGNYEKSLITMCYYTHSPINYFAKFLRKSIQKQMIFGVALVICTRCEIDLGTISIAYHTNYGVNLHDDIKKAFNKTFSQAVEAFEMLLGLK